jgi:hypothetical protein
MLKRTLRWVVVWTSRSPLVFLYRAIYRLTIEFASFVLRRCPGIVSIYLCRGCAKDEIRPGISDIDFMLVTAHNGEQRRLAQRVCHTLGTVTAHLIDYYPNLVATRKTIEHRWRTSPAWQYRYLEGKATWKLLYGTDVLGSLPHLTETQRQSSCYAEMTRWWLLFAQLLITTRKYHRDVVMRNVTCYKAVSELLRVYHALRTGQHQYSGAAALQADSTPLAEQLREIARRRFLASDDRVMDETYRFLLTFFQQLWAGFRERPFLSVCPHTLQAVDCLASEFQVGEQAARHLRVLRGHVDTQWRSRCRGVHVVKSAFWNMEDLLWIADIDEGALPPLREVTDLATMHLRTWGDLPQRIFLFLRLGSVGFPITPVTPRDLHRGLLTPATTPDVFLQLKHTEVYWTDHTKWYLSDWRTNEQWLGVPGHKQLQLDIIARSAAKGHVAYPLTLAALERHQRELP